MSWSHLIDSYRFSCCSFSTRYTITRVRNKGEKDEFSETVLYTIEGDATSYDSSYTDGSDDSDDHEMWGGHSMVKRRDARDGDSELRLIGLQPLVESATDCSECCCSDSGKKCK